MQFSVNLISYFILMNWWLFSRSRTYTHTHWLIHPACLHSTVIPSCWHVGTRSLSADLVSVTWLQKCNRSCPVWKESTTSVWRLTMSTWTSRGRTRPWPVLQTRPKLQTWTQKVMLPAESIETQTAAFRNTKDHSRAGKYNDEIGQFSLDVLSDFIFLPTQTWAPFRFGVKKKPKHCWYQQLLLTKVRFPMSFFTCCEQCDSVKMEVNV